MSSSVVYRPQARLDIVDCALFISDEHPQAAARFLDAVELTLERLAAMPNIGKPRHFGHPDLEGVRSWPVKGFKNYLIFYRPTDDGIELIRLLHGARDIPAVFESDTE